MSNNDADLMAFMAEIDSIEKKNEKTKKRNVVEVRDLLH